MSDQQSKLIGYGLVTFLSVILFIPMLEWMNLYLPAGVIGDAIAAFFWLVYPIAILYLIYLTITTALYG